MIMAAMGLDQEQLFSSLKAMSTTFGTKRYMDIDHYAPPGRKITVPSNTRLSKGKLLLVAMAYRQESETASSMLAFAGDSGDLDEEWDEAIGHLLEWDRISLEEILTRFVL